MKWTVLFIVHGLGDGLQEQSRVLTNVVGYGNWLLKYTNLLYLKSEIDHTGKTRSITTVLHKVNSLQERRRGKPDVERIRKFRNINIGNRYRLTGIFSHVKKEFPAEKLMLVVFDHGAGFGIFEPIPEKWNPVIYSHLNEVEDVLMDTPPRKLRRQFVPPVSSGFYPSGKYKRHGHQKGMPDAGETGRLGTYRNPANKTDMLTMEELSGAIRKGFKRKVDIMVMVNCNMQMIETGYSLRRNVDYLVASESMFWVYGINYREVLFRIDRNGNIAPEKVAQLCIDTLKVRYERIGKEDNLSDVSFSAIDLQRMWPVYKKVNQLAGLLLKDGKNNIKMISKARNAGVDLSQFNLTQEQKDAYEPLFFYDLLFFLKKLGGYEKEVTEIERLITAAMVNRYIGLDFKKRNKTLVNGLSVYFPLTKEDFEMQYFDLFYKENAKFKTDFAKTNWGKLLRAIKKQAE